MSRSTLAKLLGTTLLPSTLIARLPLGGRTPPRYHQVWLAARLE
jgi:hypothetical protein